MATFTVHVPPGIADPALRAEKTAFVRDGFSVPAFVFGPVYLVYHRLWRATLLWVVVAAVMTALARGLALSVLSGLGLYLVIAILTGLEAGQARQAAYRWRGYIAAAVLSGVRRQEAERRFYEAEASGRLPPLATPPREGAIGAEPVIGLFPEPGAAVSDGRARTAIVDYGSGNLNSAAKAFERAAREAELDLVIEVTSDPERVRTADRVVLPGVGAFAECRRGLDAVAGLVGALTEAVIHEGRPFLGICVGMQLMASRGREHRTAHGLDWIPGEVAAIAPKDPALKIPHMGWNTLRARSIHPLLEGIPTGEHGLHAYFVHSYAFQPDQDSDVVAVTDYGAPITAIVARDNMAGTQFHPEKSQRLGLALIANFLRWQP